MLQCICILHFIAGVNSFGHYNHVVKSDTVTTLLSDEQTYFVGCCALWVWESLQMERSVLTGCVLWLCLVTPHVCISVDRLIARLEYWTIKWHEMPIPWTHELSLTLTYRSLATTNLPWAPCMCSKHIHLPGAVLHHLTAQTLPEATPPCLFTRRPSCGLLQCS